MKNIINIYFIVTISCLFFPRKLVSQIEYKIDSIQTFDWDNALEWQLTVRDHYSYANGGNDFTNYNRLEKDSNTMQWENSFQQIRTFNSENNLDTEIFQFWDGTQWMNNSKSTYNYDTSQNNDVITHYNYIGNDWSLQGRQLMAYNQNNLIVETISQEWNSNASDFDNISRSTNTYDTNLISESIFQIWSTNTSIFENISKSVNTYEGNQIKQQDSYTWNNGNWNTTPNSCTIYTYIGPLVKTLRIQVNYGGGLENQSLTIYDYLNDNPIEITQQMWEDTGDGTFDWVNSNQQLFTYDINNQISTQISSVWGPSSTWDFNQKSIYYISETLAIPSENLDIGKVYPNPFSDELNILLKFPIENDGLLEIFDVKGKRMSKTELRQGVKSVKLNNSYLSHGLYFIKYNP